MNVLYILMRTDLLSMNAGKAMAQASHASNDFVHHHHDKPVCVEWQCQTEDGFGTVLVVAADITDINRLFTLYDCDADFNDDNICFGKVTDPTYPYIVNSEIFSILPEELHTERARRLDNGDYLCFRKEVTCAYVCGKKEDENVKKLVGYLKLHP